ncbi:MAG: tetratricopeptide repeat protein, partial [Acidobacteriota bacterium]
MNILATRRGAGRAGLIALLLSGLVMAAACRKPTPDAHAEKAAAFFAESRFPEAIIEYRAALQIAPQRGDLRLKLADTYVRTNDLANALREYVRAADLLPNNVDAQLKAGNLLLLARAFEDAKTRADKVLALEASNVNGQILRGNALAGLKDLDGAISEYEEVIARDPTSNQAFMSLGMIQAAKCNTTEAEDAF